MGGTAKKILGYVGLAALVVISGGSLGLFATGLTTALAGTTVIGSISALSLIGIGAIAAVSIGFAPEIPDIQAAQNLAENVSIQTTSSAVRSVIFGRCGIAGQLLFRDKVSGSGGDPDELLAIFGLAGYPVTSLEKFWLNGVLVYDGETTTGPGAISSGTFSGELWVWFRTGEETSQAFSSEIGSLSSAWNAKTRVLRGIPCIAIRLKVTDKLEGRLEPLAQVKGSKLYDPRLDSTVPGGSGTHRFDDPSTWEFSTNAALPILLYLRGGDIEGPTNTVRIFGMGVPDTRIDLEHHASEANICEEQIDIKAGGTINRYDLDGRLVPDQDHRRNLQALLSASAGTIDASTGVYRYFAAAWRASSKTLTEDDIHGAPNSIDLWKDPSEEVNVITGVFADSNDEWNVKEYPERRDDTSISKIGENVVNMDLPFTIDYRTAQRLAKIRMSRANAQKGLSATYWLRALPLQPGDNVTLTYSRYGFSADTMRVNVWALERSEDDNGNPRIAPTMQLIEEKQSWFDWDETTEEVDLTGVDPLPSVGNAPSVIELPGVDTLIFVGASPPSNPGVGWLWQDTGTGIVYRWDGASWVQYLKGGGNPGDSFGGSNISDWEAYPSDSSIPFYAALQFKCDFANNRLYVRPHSTGVSGALTLNYHYDLEIIGASVTGVTAVSANATITDNGSPIDFGTDDASSNEILWGSNGLVHFEAITLGGTDNDEYYLSLDALTNTVAVRVKIRRWNQPEGCISVGDKWSQRITEIDTLDDTYVQFYFAVQTGQVIIWKGALSSAPSNPQLNWAYYNTTDGKAYIWDGDSWETLTVDGSDGATGPTGPAGADGSDGADGANVAQALIFQRTATEAAPAVPSATATYTFATGDITGLNNGWTDTIPAYDGSNPYLWASTAPASGTGATDTIGTGEWATPRVIATQGELSGNALNFNRRMSSIQNWFTSPGGSTVIPSSIWSIDEPGDGPVWETCLKGVENSSTSRNFFSPIVAIDPTKKHRVSVWVEQPSGDRRNYLLVAFLDSSKVNISSSTSDAIGWTGLGTYHYWQVTSAAFPTTWTKYTYEFGGDSPVTIPSGAAYLSIGGLCLRDGPVGTNTTIRLNDYKVEELANNGPIQLLPDPTVRLGSGYWDDDQGFTYITGGGIDGDALQIRPSTSLSAYVYGVQRRGPFEYDALAQGKFVVEVRWRVQLHDAGAAGTWTQYVRPIIRVTDEDGSNASTYLPTNANLGRAWTDSDTTGVWYDQSCEILVEDSGSPPRFIQVGIYTSNNAFGPYFYIDRLEASIRAKTEELTSVAVTHKSVSSSSGVLTIDLNDANSFTCTLTENITSIVINNWKDGVLHGFDLEFIQDSTARTITIPSSWKSPNGVAYSPSTGSGQRDRLHLESRNQGTTVDVTFVKNLS